MSYSLHMMFQRYTYIMSETIIMITIINNVPLISKDSTDVFPAYKQHSVAGMYFNL